MSLYGPFLEIEDSLPIYKRKFKKTFLKFIINTSIPVLTFSVVIDHISYIEGQQLERTGIKKILFIYLSFSLIFSLFITTAFTKPKPKYFIQHLNRKMDQKSEKEEVFNFLNTKEYQKFSKLNK